MSDNRVKHQRWINFLLLALPFLLVLLIMLPRLLSPQFGFEDDGVSLSMAQKALAGRRIDIDDNVGFFRPMYWLGLIFQYRLGGTNPFWFYFINLLVLFVIIAEILVLIRLKGGSLIQSSLSAIIFVFSSPIIESFYTNSKPEAQQLMWLAGSLLSGHFLAHPRKSKQFIAFITTTLLILLASLNKSTFITLVPVSLIWMILCWIFIRRDKEEIKRTAYYFMTTLLATASFFILRRFNVSENLLQGTYTNDYTLNLNFMIFMLNHWIVWLTRGYLGLLPCLVLLLVFWMKFELTIRKLAIASLVWILGWFAVYLPWGHAIDYYLLPAAMGFAIFCGVVVGFIPVLLPEIKTPARIIVIGLAGIFGLFLLMGAITNVSNAKIQMIMDRQDMRLLTYLAESSLSNARIAVNFNENATFFRHVALLYSVINDRSKLNLIPFQFQDALSENEETYLLVMPVIRNQPLVKVRGFGERQTPVNRSLEAFINDIKPVFDASEKAHLLTFNPAILLCPFTRQLPFYSIYCNKPASLLVDSRDYTFGWQVYEINTSIRNMSTPAVYTPAGELKIYDQEAPSLQYSFPPGNHPLAADWNADGLTDVVLYNSRGLAWQIYLAPFDYKPLTLTLPGSTAEDVPLTGDWNCDGKASPGYYRPSDSSWHLWNYLEEGEVITSLTGARLNDIPVVGDWDGDGCDTVGVYRPDKGEVNLENELSADLGGIDFNAPIASIPVPAEWGGLGLDTLGFFKDGQWLITYANCECPPANGLKQIEFGAQGDVPLAGRWK